MRDDPRTLTPRQAKLWADLAAFAALNRLGVWLPLKPNERRVGRELAAKRLATVIEDEDGLWILPGWR